MISSKKKIHRIGTFKSVEDLVLAKHYYLYHLPAHFYQSENGILKKVEMHDFYVDHDSFHTISYSYIDDFIDVPLLLFCVLRKTL